MKIGKIRTLIEDKSDKELVFFSLIGKNEADEYILNNEEDKRPLTDNDWIYVYTRMIEDEDIWTEINDSLKYYISNVMEQRAKGLSDIRAAKVIEKEEECFICGGIATHFEATTSRGACCKCCGDCPENCKGRKGIK